MLLFETHHTSPLRLLKEPVCLTVSVCLAQNHRPECKGGAGGTQETLCYKKQRRGEIKAIYPNILLETFHCSKRQTEGREYRGTRELFVQQTGDKWEDKESCVFSGEV